MKILVLLFFFNISTLSSLEYDEDDYEDENTCLPQLADHCFSELYKNLACHLDPTYTQNCHKRDAEYLCRSSLDALNCASDIVDGDCSLKQGRLQFDSWMAGLKGVYSSLCDAKRELLKLLLNNTECWSSLDFLKCVKGGVKVTHIVDLLKTQLDLNTCNHLLVALVTCNVRATSLARSCHQQQLVISEVLHTFFTKTECGSTCGMFTQSTSSLVKFQHDLVILSVVLCWWIFQINNF